jgi:RHS repeat-associated protein
VAEKRIDFAYNALDEFSTITRYKDLDGGPGHEVVTSTSKYDGLARLTNLEHKKTGSSAINTYTFAYNTVNRLTSMTSVDGLVNYTYDSTGQLTVADHATQTDESYVHDLNGNRVTANGQTYATGTNNQLTTDGVYNYEYDNEGNQKSRTKIATGEVTEYFWDHRNRLITVKQRASAGGVIQWQVDYGYDAFDRMISRTLDADGQGGGGAVTTFFVYDGLQVVLALSPSGAVERRMLWGPAIDQLLASEDAGGVKWALADHLGTVRDVVDSSGTLITHRKYDAFGNLVSGSTDPGWYLGYTGRFFDLATGLQWNWQRWYDPKTGRWLSPDPINFLAGDTNLYRYVGNGPMNATDPLGLFDEQQMLNILKFLDPDVYNWWRRHGRTDQIPAKGWIGGWFTLDVHPSYDTSDNAAVIRLAEEFTPVEAALALSDTARNQMLGAWAQAFPSHKWQQDHCEPGKFHAWQREQFRQGTEYARAFAELYVNGVLSFNAGGDAIVSINDVLENGLSWNSILTAMPILRTAGGTIKVRIGDRDIVAAPATLNGFAQLSSEQQAKVVTKLNKARSLEEASRLLTILACFAAGTPVVIDEGSVVQFAIEAPVNNHDRIDHLEAQTWNLPLLSVCVIAFAGAAACFYAQYRKRLEEELGVVCVTC